MNKRIVEIANKAFELIKNEENWCQIDWAQYPDGTVPTEDDERDSTKMEQVTRFCSWGAINYACRLYDAPHHWVYNDLDEFCLNITNSPIITFNDAPGRTHAEVVEVWKKMLFKLKERYALEAA